MKVIRPQQTLLFLIAVAVVCGSIALVFPTDGLQVAGYTFRFKSWNEQPDSAAMPAVTDIDAHLAMPEIIGTCNPNIVTLMVQYKALIAQ